MTPERFTEIFESIEPLISNANYYDLSRIYSHRENFLRRAEALSDNDSITMKHRDSYIKLASSTYDIAMEIHIDLLALARETLVKKAKEYSMDGDRLWNFKPNYTFMDWNPLHNLNGYLRKHLASCMDILSGKIEPTKEMIIEKFGDVYNYCILAIALIEENKDFEKKVGLKEPVKPVLKDL